MRPILVTGASGRLGRAVAAACAARDLAAVTFTHAELDVTDRVAVGAALDRHDPWAVCNAAGVVRASLTAADSARCRRVNALGPRLLADECHAAGIRLLAFSSDFVFDGEKASPYHEGDRPRPQGDVGESQHAGEAAVLARAPEALVVRTSAPFGGSDDDDFVGRTLAALRADRPVLCASDALVTPTYLPELVDVCLDLLIDGERGVWHLVHEGPRTWADVARAAARVAGLCADRVQGRPRRALPQASMPPRHRPLASRRGELLSSLDDALVRYQRRYEERAP